MSARGRSMAGAIAWLFLAAAPLAAQDIPRLSLKDAEQRALQDHPQLGRVVPEYGHWQLRELVDKWNRVLYRLRPDAIEVVTIVPARIPVGTRDHEND